MYTNDGKVAGLLTVKIVDTVVVYDQHFDVKSVQALSIVTQEYRLLSVVQSLPPPHPHCFKCSMKIVDALQCPSLDGAAWQLNTADISQVWRCFHPSQSHYLLLREILGLCRVDYSFLKQYLMFTITLDM